MIYSERDRALIWLSVQDLSLMKKQALFRLCKLDALDLWNNLEAYHDTIAANIDQVCFEKLKITNDNMYMQSFFVDMEKYNVKAVTYYSELYPDNLKEIDNPPLVLYYKGNPRLMNGSLNIAIVGTREPTRYGLDATESFATDLISHGFTVVSGMARGIDTLAHKVCLKYNKPTIAVMGCGLDIVYPAENKELYEQIVESGLVISEYPLGTQPHSYNFPERNRIISGISSSVLVTEAGENSGSLITLGCAIEQNKSIYVVPGSIYNKKCNGSNRALNKYFGCAVLTAMDIILDYNIRYDVTSEPSQLQLDYVEELVVSTCEKQETHIEELIKITGLSINQLSPILLKLEVLGLVKKLYGNYYGV